MENRIYCAVSYNDNGEQIIHAISFDRNSIKEYINGYKSETLLSLGIIFTDKKDVYICSEQGLTNALKCAIIKILKGALWDD